MTDPEGRMPDADLIEALGPEPPRTGWSEDTVRESLLVDALERIRQLKTALLVQWEYNHAEHCGPEHANDQDPDCHWPLPVELGGNEHLYRTYDRPPGHAVWEPLEAREPEAGET